MSANLTPVEIIKLGMEHGYSPDVILASLEAGGWVCVPVKPTPEMVQEGEAQHNHWGTNPVAIYLAFLAARPKNMFQATTAPASPPVRSPEQGS